MKRRFNNYNTKQNNRREKTPEFRGASVGVRNGDVNGALRRLKKILENDNRQKELAKREYYEKPSVGRKRRKDQAIKRHKKEMMRGLLTGDSPVTMASGVDWMKSKRKRRRHMDLQNSIKSNRRNRGL
jgi:ribosomal protein S21